MRAASLPLEYNAVDILERNLPARAGKVALYSESRSMTFREVSDEVNQVGNGLKRLGIRFGDCVAILYAARLSRAIQRLMVARLTAKVVTTSARDIPRSSAASTR